MGYSTGLSSGISGNSRNLVRPGFDAIGCNRHIGNQQQCTARYIVGMTNDKQGRGFHVDANTCHVVQLAMKSVVMFPDSPVRCVDYPGPVIQAVLEDFV